jgi:hypothetical protein
VSSFFVFVLALLVHQYPGQAAEIYDLVADRKSHLFRDWLLADITAARGHLGEAERLLHDVRDGFMEHGFAFEAALADLEMAKVAAATDRWSAATQFRLRGFRTLRAAAAP